MLELVRLDASIVGVFAAPQAVAAVHAGPATVCRVAPDEAMVVGGAGDGEPIVAALEASVGAIDPDGIVLETTDGWSGWTLRGDAVGEAFGCVSELEPPSEGFIQGAVADVPVRVVVASDGFHLFVPAMWGAYLQERILSDCAYLGVREMGPAEVLR